MVAQTKEFISVDNVKVKITILDYKIIMNAIILTERTTSLDDIIVYCKNTKN